MWSPASVFSRAVESRAVATVGKIIIIYLFTLYIGYENSMSLHLQKALILLEATE